jgi:hypothetical protein
MKTVKIILAITAILIVASCRTRPNHIVVCDPAMTSHICPGVGHGPCPICPPVSEYRYEVRIINPSTNELLHMTNEFNDAYEYVVDYSSSHSDLVIYDLETGDNFIETP